MRPSSDKQFSRLSEAEAAEVKGGAKDPNWRPGSAKGVGATSKANVIWDMPESGTTINGRRYTQHALERMAPDTPQVRAELSKRAHEFLTAKGYIVGSNEYIERFKEYVNPRNIPPMVIENIVKTVKGVPGKVPGTVEYITEDVKIILNELGDVITIWAK